MFLGKVSTFTTRTAAKDHICDFTGKKIYENQLYYSIVFKPTKLNTPSEVEEGHFTYKLSYDELENFIHENCYISVIDPRANLKKDLYETHLSLQKFWDKYKDMPSAKEILGKFKDLLTLPL